MRMRFALIYSNRGCGEASRRGCGHCRRHFIDFLKRHEAILDGERTAIEALPGIKDVINQLRQERRL